MRPLLLVTKGFRGRERCELVEEEEESPSLARAPISLADMAVRPLSAEDVLTLWELKWASAPTMVTWWWEGGAGGEGADVWIALSALRRANLRLGRESLKGGRGSPACAMASPGAVRAMSGCDCRRRCW